ncbi:hypothetical protein JAB6_40120 [Janthinobacterium sp. HH104]|uniref:hypothetical protein n=1 Tax=Janthinobacterium sp. HH104 TaxID=1537276 RepID=UPI000874EBED|nr:hypothetical protein [Janthinobacterium sp. HH104]OEZ80977.1 hypothetical protein JAB6_40120 [Janthinobacterium sp. HH104]
MKITPIQLKALSRFRECCEDSASGGHDVPKEMMQRLAAVGVVRTLGFGRHETTEFGDWLLAQPPEAKVSTLAVPDGWKLVPAEPNDAMQAAGAQAVRIDTTVTNKIWTGNAVFRAMLAAAPAAPAAQGDVKDEKAELVRSGLTLMVNLKTVKDELEALKGDAKDAERYRWLRDGDKDGILLAFMAGHSRVPADVVDSRIDAAISAGELPVIEKEGA